MSQSLLPVFPLQLVLFPGMLLPLHIFEERYREMIARCLEKKEPFAIVLVQNDAVMETATLAEIVAVVKEYPDGRMDILTRGNNRVVLKNVSEAASYLQAEYSVLEDLNPAAGTELVEKGRNLLRAFIKHSGDEVDEERLGALPADELGFLIAAHGGFSLLEKQRFLEMTDASERLDAQLKLAEILDARATTDAIERKPISTNGKLPH
ncbi:MAG: LON peptidase substrate-binding domain-containing protein [Calditrichia bacterium]